MQTDLCCCARTPRGRGHIPLRLQQCLRHAVLLYRELLTGSLHGRRAQPAGDGKGPRRCHRGPIATCAPRDLWARFPCALGMACCSLQREDQESRLRNAIPPAVCEARAQAGHRHEGAARQWRCSTAPQPRPCLPESRHGTRAAAAWVATLCVAHSKQAPYCVVPRPAVAAVNCPCLRGTETALPAAWERLAVALCRPASTGVWLRASGAAACQKRSASSKPRYYILLVQPRVQEVFKPVEATKQ